MLSRMSCRIMVHSLQLSSLTVSMLAMASSKARFASSSARSRSSRTSHRNTAVLRCSDSRTGLVCGRLERAICSASVQWALACSAQALRALWSSGYSQRQRLKSASILRKKTMASAPLMWCLLGNTCSSSSLISPWHTPPSSFSISPSYFSRLSRSPSSSRALPAIACTTLSSARLEQTTLLQADAHRLRSAGVSSSSESRTSSAKATISSQRSVCCASFASSTQSSFLKSLAFIIIFKAAPSLRLSSPSLPTSSPFPSPSLPPSRPPAPPPHSCLPNYNIFQAIKMNLVQADKSAFSVGVELSVRWATTAVRFPCLFSVQWRTNNQKVSVETGRYSPQGGRTDFNEDLLLRTEVAYDKTQRRFLKRETQVQLNLVSKSRPDQSKLVGRVTVDLAAILNDGLYAEPTEFPLQFCSVNAVLLLAFRVTDKIESDLSVSELELSLAESLTMNSALKLGGGASSLKERPRESAEESSEGPVSKAKADPPPIKKELTPVSSPAATEPRNTPDLPKKEAPAKGACVQEKPVTRSFKSIHEIKESAITRKSEPTEDFSQQLEGREESKKSSFKKMGSISSEDGRLSEDFSRQKAENDRQRMEADRARMEADRYRQEAELNRLQLEKVKQEHELAKLELKQKKTSVDQSASENSSIRADLARTREELGRSREEAVSLTLRLAELREAHNRVLVQSSVSERELGKLEGSHERVRALTREKDDLQAQLAALQAELTESHSRCEQLHLQNGDLKASLSNLDQMHQEALAKCTETEEDITRHRSSSEQEARALRDQLKAETKQRMESELALRTLNEDVERLMAVASEFEEARHSWSITEALHREETDAKNARVRELEDSLLGLEERVRWLEGENELLTDNARRSREECVRAKSERDGQAAAGEEATRQYEQALQRAAEERGSLEREVGALEELVGQLQQQGDDLRSANDFQTDNILNLETTLAELALKNHELEELVLNLNELRDKERQQCADRETALVVRVAELEGNTREFEELVQANAERVAVVEEELRGREALIVRLQEGLRAQVERGEQLNNRVMGFLEREERMKETLLLLEIEARRVAELLSEQEASERQAHHTIEQLQNTNAELAASLQDSLHYAQGLEELSKSNEQTAAAKITSLTKELEKKTQESAQNKATIDSRNSKIKELQSQYSSLQAQAKDNSSKHQQALEELTSHVAFLEGSIQALEDSLAQKTTKLEQVEGELSNKHTELAERLASIDRQTAEFERLCGQLKEIEHNHEREIHEGEERYLDTISKYQELENASAIKEEQHTETTAQLQQQVKDLTDKLTAISKDSTTLAVSSLKSEVKEKNEEIKRLEGELRSANAEAAKVPGLERSLKIRSIELNSLKFKGGKGDGYEGTELLRLKDEEISALAAERDRLIANEGELQTLKEKSEALATELELIEEEKFNIESQSNERALQLEEARDENRKLMDEITIIGERNGELEKALQEMLSKEGKAAPKGEAALKAEVTLLRGQLRELETARQRVRELEQGRKTMQEEIELKEEQHMIALIDQQFKLAKNESQSSNAQARKAYSAGIEKQAPNLASTCRCLREIIDERARNKDHVRLGEVVECLLGQKEAEGVLAQRSRSLSKEFQRLKLQVMKFDGKAGQERLKLVNLFKVYEGLVMEVVRLSEGHN